MLDLRSDRCTGGLAFLFWWCVTSGWHGGVPVEFFLWDAGQAGGL